MTVEEAAASFTWPSQLPPSWTIEWDTTSGEDRVELRQGWLHPDVTFVSTLVRFIPLQETFMSISA